MRQYQPWPDVAPGTRKAMQANRARDTQPEVTVRRLLHGMGYRFRLYRKDLPGKPDIVFMARRKIIEVRGCYWHGHGCKLGQPARTNTTYWAPKITRNKERDARNISALSESGWEVFEIWECRLRQRPEDVHADLAAFLGPPRLVPN
jgi:DNA mismatch endonuclease (patch repair protein)